MGKEVMFDYSKAAGFVSAEEMAKRAADPRISR